MKKMWGLLLSVSMVFGTVDVTAFDLETVETDNQAQTETAVETECETQAENEQETEQNAVRDSEQESKAEPDTKLEEKTLRL